MTKDKYTWAPKGAGYLVRSMNRARTLDSMPETAEQRNRLADAAFAKQFTSEPLLSDQSSLYRAAYRAAYKKN